MSDIVKRREYKSGTRWGVWLWTFTPSGYITRLHIVKTPWFAVMLHWINGPDPEPDMHDHPVTFLSVILRGGYQEYASIQFSKLRSFVGYRRCRWFNFIRAGKHVHQIVSVKPNTLTLCFVGPKVREWFFHTDDGLVPWREYNSKYKAAPAPEVLCVTEEQYNAELRGFLINLQLKRLCAERDAAL